MYQISENVLELRKCTKLIVVRHVGDEPGLLLERVNVGPSTDSRADRPHLIAIKSL